MYATLALGIEDKRTFVELMVNGVRIRLPLTTISDITLFSKRTYLSHFNMKFQNYVHH